MKQIIAGLSLLLFILTPAFVVAKPKPKPEKAPPQRLRHQGNDDVFRYTVNLAPANPQPGDTVSVFLELTQIMEKPSAIYGKFKPINDATLNAILVGPVSPNKKRKKGKPIAQRTALKMRDTGIYGFTFTATKAGLYGLHFRGEAPDVGKVSYAIPLGYDLWPIEKGTDVPTISGRIPKNTASDLEHGKALCAKYCRTDLPGIKVKNETPVSIATEFALSLSEPDLLGQVLKPSAKTLSELEEMNLLSYVHTLYTPIRDFFPKAQTFTYGSFTINNYGLKRLRKSAKLKLNKEQATGKVFIVYSGESKLDSPNLVDYEDRIAREKLQPSDKIGYLLFFKMGKNDTEVGVALKKEPSYKIANLRATTKDYSLEKGLRSFVGQGKFNDPRSIRGGSGTLRKQLQPIYLKAAELATMYYSEEREFTAFDSEFSDEDFE